MMVEAELRENAVARAKTYAPFLHLLCDRHSDLVECFITQGGDIAFAKGMAAIDPEMPVGTRLRQMKQVVALITALSDLAGEWSLDKVMLTLSQFADDSLNTAIKAAIIERVPDAEPQGLALIALGKHGSHELNYSSDVDPILVYDPKYLPRRGREEAADAAVRISRRVVELMQARDGDGYVFRVDLRLRPHPEATPIALPVDAAIGYYESAALPWERAAFIRARAAAGDLALGERFLAAIQPFVWRRTLDFGAISDIQEMSRRIRDHHAQGQKFGAGWDLKRGRGGIREVEFHAQILQMIYGGRQPELRQAATLDALQALAAAGRIDGQIASDLSQSYRLYRTIEHRLQMVDDQQTHHLPKDERALNRVAQLHGLENRDALLDLLRPHVERTGRYYDALVEAPDQAGLPGDRTMLEQSLVTLGFSEPQPIAERIENWRQWRLRALRSKSARVSFEQVLTPFLTGVAQSPAPAMTIKRFDSFLERLPSGAQFFTLLEANPRLTQLLVRLLGYAPSLAESLAERPDLIDGLIDASAFQPVPDVKTLAAELAAGAVRDDYEAVLDGVRRRVAERRFALGVHLIEGLFDPLEIAAAHSRLAEASLMVLAQAATAEFEKAHGRIAGGELLVLGLGRLGGGALTPASDLDLIFLFTGEHEAESDGRRPLGATTYFNRLAQRVVGALSVPTAQGPLYEVDTRLRPSGSQGLLAVSVDSFADYQEHRAWTWEHMALARARVVYGSNHGAQAASEVISAVLNKKRDHRALLRDVVTMRLDMMGHKQPAGSLDVKLIPGGLVDVEFVVHFYQLDRYCGFDPNLMKAIPQLIDAGLLEPAFEDAHALLTRLLICRRFLAPDAGEPEDIAPNVAGLIARACLFDTWEGLLTAYRDARYCIERHWRHIVEKENLDG